MNSSVDLSRRKEPRISPDAVEYLGGLKYLVEGIQDVPLGCTDEYYRQEVEYLVNLVKFRFDL